MKDHDPSMHETAPVPNFWRTPTGIALIVFLLIAAILLGYEHRMHIFGSNSGSVLFLAVWIAMHFFMHRGHGGHGGRGGHPSHSPPQAGPNTDDGKDRGENP